MTFTLEQIHNSVKAKGYVLFEDKLNKGYDINIVGIRNLARGNDVTNVFDDYLTLSYKVNGKWEFHQYAITTDPGTKAMHSFHHPDGVFRLKPNQYRKFWAIGKHRNSYKALVQIGTAIGWRDTNKDLTFDEVITDKGYGINCHRSNPLTQSEFVENWSEGCQVFKKAKDFTEFMNICNLASRIYGNSFTYTLLTTKDILL